MANVGNLLPVNESDEAGASNEVEAYLDQLCGTLQSIDPARREEIRREVRGHLQLLIARQDGAADATQKAQAQFGDAENVGRSLASRVRRDNLRLWLRRGPWQLRLVLLQLLLAGGLAAWLTVEFCWQMQWGRDLPGLIVIGPLIPLLMGWFGATRGFTSRWGYLKVAAAALMMSPLLPVADFLVHFDTERVGVIDMSGYVRFTYVIIWLWNASAAYGVAHILGDAMKGSERERAVR
jgi:hypothetical protein